MRFGEKNGEKYKGKLVVIDGIDGAGKSTQVYMLAKTLKEQGYDYEVIDFPQYGQKSAGMAEEYLNGKYGTLDPYKASIFFAIDRFDASFKIRKWLEQGKLVISNRYVTASAGHMGGKIPDKAERTKYFKWLDQLEYGTFGIPKPDLNILLHVPAEIGKKLVGKKTNEQRIYAKGKKRDIHERDLSHLKNAEKVFLEMAGLFPNTYLIECAPAGKLMTVEEIHGRIWTKLSKLI